MCPVLHLGLVALATLGILRNRVGHYSQASPARLWPQVAHPVLADLFDLADLFLRQILVAPVPLALLVLLDCLAGLFGPGPRASQFGPGHPVALGFQVGPIGPAHPVDQLAQVAHLHLGLLFHPVALVTHLLQRYLVAQADLVHLEPLAVLYHLADHFDLRSYEKKNN